MEIIFPLLMLVMLVGVMAFTANEGLWSNLVLLVNTLMAGLIATMTFEPAADFLTKQVPRGYHYWDFVTVWAIFIVSLIVLRQVSDLISRVSVRFLPPVETFGRWVAALANAWVVLCFTMMTLHTAPLDRVYFFGGFDATKRMVFGSAPDRQWLGLAQTLSKGSLTRGGNQETPHLHAFDPSNSFPVRYSAKRAANGKDESMFGKPPGT